ncbi:TolC family protein [uncultured Sphingobium sp.]|uniref:TolC family protein n=1 Tax=uncultured Sphingobium sp. TaxID=316087 RepID=UPI00260D5474|nr:TolC family protein [uncultured Sphingobium sp.]
MHISAERIAQIEARRDEVQASMTRADLAPDQFVRLSKEYAEIEPVAAAARELRRLRQELAALEMMTGGEEADPAMRDMAQEEMQLLKSQLPAAERALAASTAQIGVKEAQRLPGISFMGILGIGGTEPGDVLDPGNLAALLMPQISWPLLDFGRTGAQVRQARAQADQAEAQYRQSVLEGLQDAEDSLARFGATRRQLARLVASQQSAERAAHLNRLRFAAGTSSLIDQLDIERQALTAASNVAQAKAQLTIDYIAVNKALGLGWSE